jgi:hypothetical protein
LNREIFQGSWPAFQTTGSLSRRIGALVAELALPYVQWTCFISQIEWSMLMKNIAPIVDFASPLVRSLP